MSEENKEKRINVEDLPQAERELTTDEAKDVKGGVIMANTEGDFHVKSQTGGIFVAAGDVDGDNLTGSNTSQGPANLKGK